MPLTAEAIALARNLIDGIEKTFRNAEELYNEAQLLRAAGAHARALLLHQISLEECGKAEMLNVAVFETLRGQVVDMGPLAKAFSRHEAKNNTNAYFLPLDEAEQEARAADDSEAAHAAFNAQKKQFHRSSNRLKNAALYVDYNGKFTAPRDAITAEDVDEIRVRNGEFLAMTEQKLSIMTRWKGNLEIGAAEVTELWNALGFDSLDREKPESLQGFKIDLEAKLKELAEKRIAARRNFGSR